MVSVGMEDDSSELKRITECSGVANVGVGIKLPLQVGNAAAILGVFLLREYQ